MADFRIQEAASRRLDDIYAYSCETWGETQGQTYIRIVTILHERTHQIARFRDDAPG